MKIIERYEKDVLLFDVIQPNDIPYNDYFHRLKINSGTYSSFSDCPALLFTKSLKDLAKFRLVHPKAYEALEGKRLHLIDISYQELWRYVKCNSKIKNKEEFLEFCHIIPTLRTTPLMQFDENLDMELFLENDRKNQMLKMIQTCTKAHINTCICDYPDNIETLYRINYLAYYEQ